MPQRFNVLPPALPKRISAATPVLPMRGILADKKLILLAAIAAVAIFFLFAMVSLISKLSASREVGSNYQASPAPIIGSSGFQMSHRIAVSGTGNWQEANLEVTVKGKAVKLAVILTGPDGKPEIKIVESDKMITNCATELFLMRNAEPGTYSLMVKTFDPEEVVCKDEFVLSLEKLAVEDVKYEGKLDGLSISFKFCMRKEGNLPITFNRCFPATFDGVHCSSSILESGYVLLNQQSVVGGHVGCYLREFEIIGREFAGSGHHIFSGKLLYGKDNQKSVEFRKEFVVP